MIIAICGSIAHLDGMIACQEKLERLGHTVYIPSFVAHDQDGKPMDSKEFYRLRKSGEMNISWFEDEKSRAMRQHFDFIAKSDAILVVNEEKNNVLGYIGGNTLMEMAIAFYLDKKIYLLNLIPELGYKEEIIGMKPEVLDGDINRIKSD